MYYYMMYCGTTSCSVAMLACYIKSPEFVISALVSRASCIDRTTTVKCMKCEVYLSLSVAQNLLASTCYFAVQSSNYFYTLFASISFKFPCELSLLLNTLDIHKFIP